MTVDYEDEKIYCDECGDQIHGMFLQQEIRYMSGDSVTQPLDEKHVCSGCREDDLEPQPTNSVEEAAN